MVHAHLHQAPGFPQLDRFGQAARPQDQLWLCRLVGDPIAGTISDKNLEADDPKWSCQKVDELVDVAKAGYWLWKTYKWLGGVPI